MPLLSNLASLLRFGAILLPITSIVVWFWLEESVSFSFERLCNDIDPTVVSAGVRALGALAGAVHLGLLSVAIFNLAVFLRQGQEGRYLSKHAVIGFRRFAFFAVAYVLSTPLMNILASQLLTGGIAITLNTDDLKLLFGGIALIAVSHALSIARVAQDENESFI